MSPIEITATVFGFICVWLTIKQHIWCWPTGLVQVTLYIWVFYQARLYSDMGLHVIYVIMCIYGWYNWAYGGESRDNLPVTRLTGRELVLWLTAAVFGTYGLGWVMSTYTNADLAYADAATTVLSLIAQWLMARKKLESWFFWISVDILAVGIYLIKQLYPTTILYAAFLVMATTGYFVWNRDYRSPAAA